MTSTLRRASSAHVTSVFFVVCVKIYTLFVFSSLRTIKLFTKFLHYRSLPRAILFYLNAGDRSIVLTLLFKRKTNNQIAKVYHWENKRNAKHLDIYSDKYIYRNIDETNTGIGGCFVRCTQWRLLWNPFQILFFFFFFENWTIHWTHSNWKYSKMINVAINFGTLEKRKTNHVHTSLAFTYTLQPSRWQCRAQGSRTLLQKQQNNTELRNSQSLEVVVIVLNLTQSYFLFLFFLNANVKLNDEYYVSSSRVHIHCCLVCCQLKRCCYASVSSSSIIS